MKTKYLKAEKQFEREKMEQWLITAAWDVIIGILLIAGIIAAIGFCAWQWGQM